ncbi:unnamed protein product [Ixodes pacificus]
MCSVQLGDFMRTAWDVCYQKTRFSKNRFDSDPSRVPLTRELLKAVQRSHKTYPERLQRDAEDRERRKRKASTACDPVTEKKIKQRGKVVLGKVPRIIKGYAGARSGAHQDGAEAQHGRD